MRQDETVDLHNLTVKELLLRISDKINSMEESNKEQRLNERVLSLETKMRYHLLMATVFSGLVGGVLGTLLTLLIK